MDKVIGFFSDNFQNFTWLAVFFLAMLPIAEAKVAIPFAMNSEIWGESALTAFSAGFWAFLGSTLPAVFIILFLEPVFRYLKTTRFLKKITEFFETYILHKSGKSQTHNNSNENSVGVVDSVKTVEALKDSSQIIDGKKVVVLADGNVNTVKTQSKKHSIQQLITLVMFCALPLPLAGVWTSSAIASMNDMKFWPSFLAIALGNFLEVLFITSLSAVLIDSLSVLVVATLVILVLYVGVSLLIHFRKNKKIS